MYKFLLCILLLSFTTTAAGLGCSGEKDTAEGKGGRDKATERAAASAVKKITTPIQRAQDTRKLGDDRLQEMDRALEKQ
jgi:hypothetical protein